MMHYKDKSVRNNTLSSSRPTQPIKFYVEGKRLPEAVAGLCSSALCSHEGARVSKLHLREGGK